MRTCFRCEQPTRNGALLCVSCELRSDREAAKSERKAEEKLGEDMLYEARRRADLVILGADFRVPGGVLRVDRVWMVGPWCIDGEVHHEVSRGKWEAVDGLLWERVEYRIRAQSEYLARLKLAIARAA